MKSVVVYLAMVVYLATLIPQSHQQDAKPHAWMPQGRFGKRISERHDESAVIRALFNSKCV